ncbi:MAG: lactate racemase domain-containing protein, partial [Halobacteriota archaeon]
MGKSRLTLKYGDRKTAVTVNERNLIQVIQPNEIEAGDEESEIIRAMQHPIETPTLNEIVLACIFALRSRFGRCSAHDYGEVRARRPHYCHAVWSAHSPAV